MSSRTSPNTASVAMAALLLSFTTVACIESKSVTCENGLVCPAGMYCAANELRCLEGRCGDGTIQIDQEQCDDGNTVAADGCSSDCKFEVCGNGIKDPKEDCDTGADGGNGCNSYCKRSNCGNGILDPEEACEDGNTRSGDGCNSDCTSTERCGNGVLDPGEVCEPSLTSGPERCSSDCKSTVVCGNGIIDPTNEEACDDGNTLDGDGCSADCHSDESCGNRFLDAWELCDDGNNLNGDGCSADCRSNGQCGNGLLDPGEECDDGDDSNNNECLNTCKRATCGDGYVRETGATPEACDDGNASACGACNSTCTQEQNPARARGTLLVDLSDGGVQDGEILIVSDGVGRCIFEFDTDGTFLGTHAQVRPTEPDNGPNVAYHLHAAIRDATTRTIKQGCGAPPGANSLAPRPALRLQIRPLDGGTRLELEHSHPGSQGNQPIIESVEHPGFTATALHGGAGWDCPVETGCTSPHDCDPVEGTITCVIPDGGALGRCGPPPRGP